jgi:hypothetical protein
MTQRWAAAMGICAAVLAGSSAGSVGVAQERHEPDRCVAVMIPSVQGITGNAEDAAAGVRDLIAKYLSGPSLKVVTLESRLASQAVEEAREKHCEPILVTSLTRKTGGGQLTKALGQAAGNSSVYFPGGGTIGSTAVLVATQTGLRTAASLASSTRAKDSMSLEYRLQSSTGDVRFGPRTEARKASVDGEDLVTPIVMRVAEAIVTRKGDQ